MSPGGAEVGAAGWCWGASAVGLSVSVNLVDREAWDLEIPSEEVAECEGVVYQEACEFGVSASALLLGFEFGVVEVL